MSGEKTRKKILIIDNNPTIAELIKYALNPHALNQGERYNVIAAYNDQEGLERLHIEQPDCVVFDVRIAKEDHYRLEQLLHAIRTANIPSVILVGARQEEQVKDVLSRADEYLVIPFRPTDLQAAIERITAQ